MKCFWCGIMLDEGTKTRDHLISRSLCRLSVIAKQMRRKVDYQIISCLKCNRERSQISSLLDVAWRVFHGCNDQLKRRFAKQKDKIFSNLNLYKERISSKLRGEVAEMCLLEIDFILRCNDPKLVERELQATQFIRRGHYNKTYHQSNRYPD